MLNKRILLTISCCCILLLVATSAFAGGGRRANRPQPLRFLPGTDEGLVQLTNAADNVTWSAWSYRNGAERDIALSVVDDGGRWTEPVLLGLDDGVDQVQPALTADAGGTLYLLYGEREAGRILLSTRTGSATSWSTPVAVTQPGEFGHSPAVTIVAEWVIVAYRSVSGTSIKVLPVVVAGVSGLSIQEGPDPVGTKPPDQDEDGEDDSDSGDVGDDTGSVEFGSTVGNNRY